MYLQADLVAANTELRRLFLANGVTAELHEMRERMEGLLGRINTAEVVPLRKTGRGWGDLGQRNRHPD